MIKVIATNVGQPTTIEWNGKEIQTGIYKYPVLRPIFLQSEQVENDTISDRKVHGGIHKACFLFSQNQYPYWKKLYPTLDWDWGMFGENLSMAGMDESEIRIGDIYKIGQAIVQVSQPREPCYKLGIRFKSQLIIKQYIAHGFPGTYARIIQKGVVKTGDKAFLMEQSKNALTVKLYFDLLFAQKKDNDLVKLAYSNLALPEYKRERLKKYL